MTINVVGRQILGDGQAANDDKLLHTLRDAVQHLRAGDGASVRGTDLTRLDANLDGLLDVRAANGARSNRMEAAMTRLGEVEDASVKQLSKVEDADLAKTLIELNSQTAAYQAANDKMHQGMAMHYTGNADRDFLAGMIPHHQGAIDMAEVVLKHGKASAAAERDA